MRASLFLFPVLFLALLSGCSKPAATPAAETKAAAPPAPAVDAATAATVTGTVHFEGQPPKPIKIDMAMDRACGANNNYSESVVVEKGALANALVYVKEGLGDYSYTPPTQPVVIDQHGCRYVPHVAGIMVGQELKVTNSDETTHNIHPMPKMNHQWNESQMPKSDPIEKSFKTQELMVPVKCNQHPWMRMYLNVMASPYFAVTDKDGKFTIPNLPAGTYTIAVVHETLGEQTQKITVGAKESKPVDFTYKPAPATSTGT